MTTDFNMIPLKEFTPGIVQLVKYDYDSKGNGREKKLAIRDIECIVYDFRISDNIPEGWNRYEIRGVDWSSEDSAEDILRDCKKNFNLIVPNHLTVYEFDKYMDEVKEREEDCDAFYELRQALSYAMADTNDYELEGFDQTMGERVFVDFYCTVLMKENINDIRKELGYEDDNKSEVDVEVFNTPYRDETRNFDLWNEFKTIKNG